MHFCFLKAPIAFLPLHVCVFPPAPQWELHAMQWLAQNTDSTHVQMMAVLQLMVKSI